MSIWRCESCNAEWRTGRDAPNPNAASELFRRETFVPPAWLRDRSHHREVTEGDWCWERQHHRPYASSNDAVSRNCGPIVRLPAPGRVARMPSRVVPDPNRPGVLFVRDPEPSFTPEQVLADVQRAVRSALPDRADGILSVIEGWKRDADRARNIAKVAGYAAAYSAPAYESLTRRALADAWLQAQRDSPALYHQGGCGGLFADASKTDGSTTSTSRLSSGG